MEPVVTLWITWKIRNNWSSGHIWYNWLIEHLIQNVKSLPNQIFKKISSFRFPTGSRGRDHPSPSQNGNCHYDQNGPKHNNHNHNGIIIVKIKQTLSPLWMSRHWDSLWQTRPQWCNHRCWRPKRGRSLWRNIIFQEHPKIKRSLRSIPTFLQKILKISIQSMR